MVERCFLGAGLIGASLAEAALARGDDVTVWNRSFEKTKKLQELGAHACPTIKEAVSKAKYIHLALTSDEAVNEVLKSAQEHIPKTAIIMDHSTNLPEGTSERAFWCGEHQLQYLCAPVFMSPTACLEAKGVMVVAGPKALFDSAQQALEAMTGKVWYVGQQSDRAAAYKLVGNGLILSLVSGLADAFAMGKSLGMEPQETYQLFQHFDPGLTIKGRGSRMAHADFDTLWSLRMARKDINLMLQSAEDEPLAILPAIAERMDTLIKQGFAEDDVGIMARTAHENHSPQSEDQNDA